MNNPDQAPPPDATFRTVAWKRTSNPKRGAGGVGPGTCRGAPINRGGAVIKAGLLSLILSLAMQAGFWSVRTFAMERKTAVAAAAIQAPSEAPRVRTTCPHHQHDCPADCFCPKTYTPIATDATVGADADDGAGMDTQATAESRDRDGTWREPALVACTEQGPQSTTAAADVFLAAPALSMFLPDSESSLRPMAADPLRDGLREPLLKIPI